MKRKNFKGMFTIVLMAGMTVACSKQKANKVEKNIVDGEWRITKLVDDNVDYTADFTQYTFDFKSDGTLTATSGTNSFSGTWSVGKEKDDDLFDDSPDVEFRIQLGTNFYHVNDDSWDLIRQSDTKIELGDDSKDDDDDQEYLTFEKI